MTKIFEIRKKSDRSKARAGVVSLPKGQIETPNFMAIGTAGSVKSLSSGDLKNLGSQIVLANTYHLWLKPGLEGLKNAGGLHKFMNWEKPIITDSGGFQAFSLGQNVKFCEEGIRFKNPVNGQKLFLSPEKSMQIQSIIDTDIALILDEIALIQDKYHAKKAMERTIRWSKRAKIEWDTIQSSKKEKSLLFGIPQGMGDLKLRKESALMTMELDFPGYSIGGIAPQENPQELGYEEVLAQTEILEEEKPRHILGIGTPKEIVQMIARGADLFDCVWPTRNARHGSLVFKAGEDKYEIVQIKSKRFENDFSPINPNSKLPELREYSKAYLRHLFHAKELLAQRLATLNNLEFYYNLMEKIRQKIADESFDNWWEEYDRV